MLSPLALALPAMTALQVTVALGTFSLSVLAPQLGLSVAQLAGLNTVLFGVGTAGALLAVPLTVGLVAILEATPATAGLALLMRHETPVPPTMAPDPLPAKT